MSPSRQDFEKWLAVDIIFHLKHLRRVQKTVTLIRGIIIIFIIVIIIMFLL